MIVTTLPKRRGITLIEVLIALAIFLLSIAAIGRLVDLGSENAIDSLNYATGTRLAQSKMAEVEAGVVSIAGGSGGAFEVETDWEYSIDSVQSDVPNLYTVTITASHTGRGRSATVTLTQMILDPAQMGNAAAAVKPTTTTATAGTTP